MVNEVEPLILFFNPRCAKPNFQRMPAALLQVASFIEGRFTYEIVDGNVDHGIDCARLIVEKARRGQTRYLAVSIMPGPQLVSSVRDLRYIKKHCPELVVVVGGYFPFVHPGVCVEDRDIDYVVAGHGEESFRDLIIALEEGAPPDTVPGIMFMRDGEPVSTKPVLPPDPNFLPRYPYRKLEVERYVLPTFLGSRTLSHHSSYGCPFFCNFCAVASRAKGRWMGESGERLAELTRYMVGKWRINALEFHDNNFFVSEKRVKEYCRGLEARKLEINWWGEGRVDTLLGFGDDTWQLMRDSGLKMIFLGAESGDDAALARMNKGGNHSTEGVLRLVEKMKGVGIIPELSFILGNPPDPLRDVKKGIRFIRKIKKINPAAEIIIYRYDPVPAEGEMFERVTELGFDFPGTLEGWTDPRWRKIQKRTTADVPWLTAGDQRFLSDFQTVLNAFYPTSTARHIPPGSWRHRLLRIISALRYRSGFYHKPYELEWLQQRLRYQRPEISGF